MEIENYKFRYHSLLSCRSRESGNISGGNLFLPARFVWDTPPPKEAPEPKGPAPAAEAKPAAPEAVPAEPEPKITRNPVIEAAKTPEAATGAAKVEGEKVVVEGTEKLDEKGKGGETINFGKFIESHKNITSANLEQYVATYLNITEAEQEKAKKDYADTKGGFDFQKLAAEYLPQREWLIVISTMSESDVDALFQKINETDQKLAEKNQMKEDEKKELAEAVRITKIVLPKAKEQLERRHDIEKLTALMKEGDAAKQKNRLDAYKAYLDAKPEEKEAKETKKQEFLKQFEKEENKKFIEKMLTAPQTKEEKDWVKKKAITGSDGKPLSPNELWEKVKTGELNFREAESAKRLFTTGDVEGFVTDKKMTTEEAASLKSLLTQEAKAAEAAESNIPSELKGKDFMQILQLLIDKITALFDKLGTKLDIMFNGPKLKFAASPLGFEKDNATPKKLKLAEPYQKNKGVTIEAAAETPVHSVAGGKVIEANENSAVIAFTLGKTERYIKYSNIDASSLTKNAKIGQGSPIGKALGNFQLQYFKADYKNADNEEDPTTALTHFLAPSDAEKDAAKKGAEGAGAGGAAPEATPAETETDKQYKKSIDDAVSFAATNKEADFREPDAKALIIQLPFESDNKTIDHAPCVISETNVQIGEINYAIHPAITLISGAGNRIDFENGHQLALDDFLRSISALAKKIDTTEMAIADETGNTIELVKLPLET